MKNNKLKLLICLVLVICTCFSLTACGKKEEQISSIADFDGKNIAVEFGSSNAFVIAEKGADIGANIMLAPTAADAFAMLIHEKADVYAVDNVKAKALMQQTEHDLQKDLLKPCSKEQEKFRILQHGQ